MPHSQRVYEFLQRAGANEVAEVSKLLTDDFVLDEPRSLPWGGEYRGPRGFFTGFAALSRYLQLTVSSATVRDCDDGTVLVQNLATVQAHGAAHALQTTITEIIGFAGERISRIDKFYKDTAAINAILARKHGLG